MGLEGLAALLGYFFARRADRYILSLGMGSRLDGMGVSCSSFSPSVRKDKSIRWVLIGQQRVTRLEVVKFALWIKTRWEKGIKVDAGDKGRDRWLRNG